MGKLTCSHTRGNGNMMGLMGKAVTNLKMGQCTKGNGKTDRKKETDSTCILTGITMKDLFGVG